MTRPIADLSVLRMSEAECWLLACAHVSQNTRPARMALATLRELQGIERHRELPERPIHCPAEGLGWLRAVAAGNGRDALHAAEILETVAPLDTVEHGIIVDEDEARRVAQELKATGYIGVRVIPHRLPGRDSWKVRSQGIVMRERRAG